MSDYQPGNSELLPSFEHYNYKVSDFFYFALRSNVCTNINTVTKRVNVITETLLHGERRGFRRVRFALSVCYRNHDSLVSIAARLRSVGPRIVGRYPAGIR